MRNEACQACEWLEIGYGIRWDVVGLVEGLLRISVFFNQFSVLVRLCLGQVSVFVEPLKPLKETV